MTIQNRPIQGGARIPVIVSNDQDGSGAILPLIVTPTSPTDEITGALLIIDNTHHEVHEGETYHVSYKSPDAGPIADNGTIVFALTTNATHTAHLVFDGSCGGDAEGELYEGATIANGTPLTPQNKNRNYANVNTVTVILNPTINVAGVRLENGFIPGGTGPQAAGGVGQDRGEWILKPSTIYLLVITNRAGTSQPMSLRAEWYEEPT